MVQKIRDKGFAVVGISGTNVPSNGGLRFNHNYTLQLVTPFVFRERKIKELEVVEE